MLNQKNFIGETFDNLKVLRPTEERYRNSVVWMCECNCGFDDCPKIIKITKAQLESSKYKSCKWKKSEYSDSESFIGTKFNKWTVIGIAKRKTKFGAIKWECRCDCGNVGYIEATAVRHGGSKSCGCRRGEANRERSLFKDYEGISGTYWQKIINNTVRGKRKRKLSFTITIEQAWDLFLKQEGICPLSGTKLQLELNRVKTTASLDRIDSLRGYDIDNIQWIYKDLNRMKMAMPEDVFILWCHKISDHQRSRQSAII